MKKQIYRWIFGNIMGWKIEGSIDEQIKKSVFDGNATHKLA